jgi:hypothetical protein
MPDWFSNDLYNCTNLSSSLISPDYFYIKNAPIKTKSKAHCLLNCILGVRIINPQKDKNMLKVNEYFGGTVKSIALENLEGVATIGVMEDGEYEFGTGTVEHMTITSGILDVKLPCETVWTTYLKGETFVVAKDVKFKVKANGQVAYYCLYV